MQVAEKGLKTLNLMNKCRQSFTSAFLPNQLFMQSFQRF